MIQSYSNFHRSRTIYPQTTAAKLCLEEGCENSFHPVTVVFVNVAHLESTNTSVSTAVTVSQSVFNNVAKELGLKDGTTDAHVLETRIRNHSKNITKRQHIFVVLDEIDLLFTRTNHVGKDAEVFLKTMFRWSADPQMAFSLIGISNYTDSKSLNKLELETVRNDAQLFVIYCV
jgi:Cdc6-like AAA superfamily ATPase